MAHRKSRRDSLALVLRRYSSRLGDADALLMQDVEV